MERLKAGIAEINITPSAGGLLAGDLGPQLATGVGAPLQAKALVLDNGEAAVAIITLDLFSLTSADMQALAQGVASRTGLAPEAVMIVASHTRGAPVTTTGPGVTETDATIVAAVLAQVPEAAALAQSRLEDASLGLGQATLPHLSYNHRLMTRNMKVISAWLDMPPDEVLAPEGPTDPQFAVFVVRDGRGRPLALLWSFAAENRFAPDGLLSAGLPGLVQARVDARVGRHTPCLYLGGCGGNISYAQPLEPAADAVASAVMAVQLETPTDPMVRLGAAAERVILPVRDATRFWNRPDVALKAPQAAELFEQDVALLNEENAYGVPVTVQTLRLGRYALACLPGAPFVELGLDVKQASPFQQTIVTGTNDAVGYVIPRTAFEHGGFETWTSRAARVGPGGGEYVVEVAGELLGALWRS